MEFLFSGLKVFSNFFFDLHIKIYIYFIFIKSNNVSNIWQNAFFFLSKASGQILNAYVFIYLYLASVSIYPQPMLTYYRQTLKSCIKNARVDSVIHLGFFFIYFFRMVSLRQAWGGCPRAVLSHLHRIAIIWKIRPKTCNLAVLKTSM